MSEREGSEVLLIWSLLQRYAYIDVLLPLYTKGKGFEVEAVVTRDISGLMDASVFAPGSSTWEERMATITRMVFRSLDSRNYGWSTIWSSSRHHHAQLNSNINWSSWAPTGIAREERKVTTQAVTYLWPPNIWFERKEVVSFHSDARAEIFGALWTPWNSTIWKAV